MADGTGQKRKVKGALLGPKPSGNLTVPIRASEETVESLFDSGDAPHPRMVDQLTDLAREVWFNLHLKSMGEPGRFEFLVVPPKPATKFPSRMWSQFAEDARRSVERVLVGESSHETLPVPHAFNDWIIKFERINNGDMSAKQALNQLRNAIDQVKAQARGDSDLRRESAELLEGALGELRMPPLEDWAPAKEAAQQHAPKPTKVTTPPRTEHPLIVAFAAFWDARATLSRDQIVERFQALLDQFHDKQTLGTFELNRTATQWANFISKKLKILMFNGKESVKVRCSSGIPQGYFVLCRTSGKGTPLPGTGSKTFHRLTTLSLSGSHIS